MDAKEALKAASAETAEVARIDAKIKDKLLKRARRLGMDEGEVIKHIGAWQRAAREAKRLHLGRGRQ